MNYIQRMRTVSTLGVGFALSCLLLVQQGAAQVEVILASAGPTSDIGVPGQSLNAMYSFSLSPNGQWWAGEFELDNVVDVVHLRGTGSSLQDIIWIEGDAVPGMAGAFNSVSDDRQTAVANDGVVVGLARSNISGVNSALVYRFDGTELSVVAAQDQAIPGLPGNLYDNVLHSPNVLANQQAAFVAENITLNGNVIEEDEVSLIDDGALFGGQRKRITEYDGELLQNFNDEQYFVNAVGSFLFAGDTDGATATDDIVVFGVLETQGKVVLKEGITPVTTEAGGLETFDNASQVFLASNDDWYVLGDTNGSSTEVAIRNGDVLAAEGDPSPDGFDYAQPIAFTGDGDGNFAWIWETTNPDLDRNTVLVYNGNRVLLSEGDTIMFDYDNDGVDEPAVIEFLNLDARNVALGGGYVYLMVEVDEPDTTFIGNAFIRISTFLVGDINRDGVVNLLDVVPFIDLLASGEFQAEADANGDGVVNLLDVAGFVDLLSGNGG